MKKIPKKIMIPILLLIVVVIISGCTYHSTLPEESGTSYSESYPEKPIKLLIGYSAGGGTDIGARLLATHVEDILGVGIDVVNVTGAGGWIAWSELINSEPDGYTISYINIPTMLTGYLNPDLGRPASLDMFAPICNHVWDSGTFAVNSESPFLDLQELLDFAQHNPGKLTVAIAGAFSQFHIPIHYLKQKGIDIEILYTEGVGDSIPMVLGKHVDILAATVGEVKSLVESGEVRALTVFDSKRSPHLPDVPTFAEIVGDDLMCYSARGLAAPAGVPDEIINILADAFKQGMDNAEHTERMNQFALDIRFMDPNEYKEFLKQSEKDLIEIFDW